ncbi:MAG: Rieske (2Fe-2S) region [Dehalococcoidia bacterium]|nr:Rieske (2Fe-2S) region [Dehalococcoidia bacterium]
MAEYIKVAQAKDISPGQMTKVEVEGEEIAIANVDGQFFAFSDGCTHALCSLTEDGELDGEVVMCGCHGSEFNVKTGEVVQGPADEPVKSYPVQVDGDDVKVSLA